MWSSAATISRTEEGPLEALKNKNVGYAVAVVGVLVALAGAFADTLGIGKEGADGMGGKQLALLLVGLVILAVGGVIVFLASQGTTPTSTEDVVEEPAAEEPAVEEPEVEDTTEETDEPETETEPEADTAGATD